MIDMQYLILNLSQLEFIEGIRVTEAWATDYLQEKLFLFFTAGV